MLADMAMRTGIPQRILARRFTTEELAELFAARKIDFESAGKEDVRAQMLAYHIVCAVRASAGGAKSIRGIKPELFALNWGKTKSAKPKNKAELEANLRAMCKIYSRGK